MATIENYEIVRHVSMPVSSWKTNPIKFLQILTEIKQSDVIQVEETARGRKPKEEDKKKEPPYIFQALDLETERPVTIICNTVLKSIIEREYPTKDYTGKCFRIQDLGTRQGKDYHDFEIAEIKDPRVKQADIKKK